MVYSSFALFYLLVSSFIWLHKSNRDDNVQPRSTPGAHKYGQLSCSTISELDSSKEILFLLIGCHWASTIQKEADCGLGGVPQPVLGIACSCGRPFANSICFATLWNNEMQSICAEISQHSAHQRKGQKVVCELGAGKVLKSEHYAWPAGRRRLAYSMHTFNAARRTNYPYLSTCVIRLVEEL